MRESFQFEVTFAAGETRRINTFSPQSARFIAEYLWPELEAVSIRPVFPDEGPEEPGPERLIRNASGRRLTGERPVPRDA